MKHGNLRIAGLLLPVAAVALALAGCGGSAHSASVQPSTLQANQTMGFSNGGLAKFTYTQNYDCVDQPKDDLDYNGTTAGADSGELQIPICQAGTMSSIDPTGANALNTAILYVLVPFFGTDTNPADAMTCPPGVSSATTLCGTKLGNTLIALFGIVPEAYMEHPTVFTDCPTPGEPAGTCTMHTSRIDLSKVLDALGKVSPATKNIFLPSPNHSHVIANDRISSNAIWWEVVPVLVMNKSYWPAENASSGITSVAKLQAAEAAGMASQVNSNFYLFFSSQPMQDMMSMN